MTGGKAVSGTSRWMGTALKKRVSTSIRVQIVQTDQAAGLKNEDSIPHHLLRAFTLLRACTVILFLGNERRCVWGSVYVDKNGEEDPYLRRGKTLYLDESRVLALESLLVSHGYSQNTAILSNTSRRDGRRY